MLCARGICLSEFSSTSVANKLQNVSKLLRELTDNFNSPLCHVTMSTFVLPSFSPLITAAHRRVKRLHRHAVIRRSGLCAASPSLLCCEELSVYRAPAFEISTS